jgi:hypothetical protein
MTNGGRWLMTGVMVDGKRFFDCENDRRQEW